MLTSVSNHADVIISLPLGQCVNSWVLLKLHNISATMASTSKGFITVDDDSDITDSENTLLQDDSEEE